MRILLIAFLLLCFGALNARGQNTPTSPKEVMLRVDYVHKASGSADSLFVFAFQGARLGVKASMQGKLFGTYESGNDRSQKELGYCTVLKVSNDSLIAKARLYDQSDAGKVIAGDYITFTIDLPVNNHNSLFYQLGLLRILFLNNDRGPLYSLQHLLKNDSKRLEDSIMQASISDIKSVAESFRETVEPMKIEEGKYRGRNLYQVMNNVTGNDISSFLKFVQGYPGKYLGKDWKMSEVFATWVINKAPINPAEVLDSARAYTGNKVFYERYLRSNRKEIVSGEYIRNWVSEAKELYDQQKLPAAEAMMQQAERAASYLNDTVGLGFYHYVRGQMLQAKSLFREAALSYEKASGYFRQGNNTEWQLTSKLEKLSCESYIPDFAAVEKTAAEVRPLLDQPGTGISELRQKQLRGRYFMYYAYTLKRKGDLNEAKKAYESSAGYYRSMNDLTGHTQAASAREQVADIESKQNNYTAAIAMYDSLIVTYKEMALQRKVSDALNNKGYVISKTGKYQESIDIQKEALKIQLSTEDWDDAGYSFSSIGQSYWSLGDFQKALVSHTQALVYRHKARNNNGLGYSFSKLGGLYSETGDKLRAIAAYDSARYYYTKIAAHDKLAEIEGKMGDIYVAEKNFAKATSYFLSAYEALKKLGLKQEMAEQLYKIADANYKDDIETSRKYYKLAYDLYKESGVKSQMLYCLLNLGNLDTRSKNQAGAEAYFNQALALGKEINGKTEQAITYRKLGDAASYKLDLKGATDNYQKSLSIYDELEDKAETPGLKLSIAYVNILQGDFAAAEKNQQAALNMAIAANNNIARGEAYLSLADLYQMTGRMKDAKMMLDSCMKIFRQLNNSYQMANVYISLGNYYNRIFDNAKAIAHYSSADSIYLKEKEERSRFTTLNNTGTIYFYQASYDKALEYFNKAAKIIEAESTLNSDHLLVRNNIGEVYYHKKNYAEAEKYLLEAYTHASTKNLVRDKANSTLLLGKLYFSKADYPKSLSNLQNAYQYGVSTSESSYLTESALYMGKVYLALNNQPEALKYLQRSVAASERSGDTKLIWETLYQLGLIHYTNNRLDSAETYFKQAIQVVEKNAGNIYGGADEKKIFSADEKKVDLYNSVISTLIKQGKTDEALEYTTRSNAQAVKEKLAQIAGQGGSSQKSADLKKQDELTRNVSSVNETLAKEQAKPATEQNREKIASLQKVQQVMQAQLLNFVDSMVQKYPDLQENFVKNVNPEELKKYKSRIPADLAVLLYVVREDQLIIFTLTREETRAKLINISGKELSAHINDFSLVLKTPFKDNSAKPLTLRGTKVIKNLAESAKSLGESGASLYDILIAPISEDIAGKKKLCIINNGELSSIPFQAIGTKGANGQFSYLVEEYSIFYTNRLDIFSNPEPASISGASFAAYGNPDKTLPSAEAEVKQINKIITGAQVFIGDLATEEKAKAGLTTNKIVHFATHGILDYNDFSKTFLKFAQSAGSDGKLTIHEIKGLEIEDCDLVTLSACETAVSQNVNKGWYVSPANSFLVNGVKSVVASLWPVDDEATSILMSSFYENLKTMPKAEALRKAQESLSRNPKFAHPFYWGAFILYGEWR